MNLQAVDFQSCACTSISARCERPCSWPSVCHRWPSFGSTTSHLPSPQSVTLPTCSQMPAPECRCAGLLCFSRYCPVRLKMLYFFCCLSLCIMWKVLQTYYNIAVYIAKCVSWVPKLTLLDLWTNQTYKCTLRMECICMWETYCTCRLKNHS